MEIPLGFHGACAFTYTDENIKPKNTRKQRTCETFPANCFLTADGRERTPSEITSCLFNKIALDSVKSKITSSFYCNIIDPTKRYVFAHSLLRVNWTNFTISRMKRQVSSEIKELLHNLCWFNIWNSYYVLLFHLLITIILILKEAVIFYFHSIYHNKMIKHLTLSN